MPILFILLSTFLAGTVFGGGGEAHHGSAMDLIAPFVNLTLLLSFLVWKLKTPAKNFFSRKSNSVAEVLERASVKAKEAQMMMQVQKDKNNSLSNEIAAMEKDITESVRKFREDYQTDIDNRVAQLKSDAAARIEAEKREMLNNLNDVLLDKVIYKAKSVLKNNEALSNKVTTSLLEGLK